MVPTLDRRGVAHFSDRRIGLHHLWLSNLTPVSNRPWWSAEVAVLPL